MGHTALDMLYAILCYDSEDSVGEWTPEKEAEVMARLRAVQVTLTAQGRLGPVARLQPSTSAKTIRKGAQAMVLDGPFAETKEQLLGFYVVECASIEAALDVAQDLARASGSAGALEVRPIMEFRPAGIPPA